MSCLCDCIRKIIGRNKTQQKEEERIFNNKQTSLIRKKNDLNSNADSKDQILFNSNNNLSKNLKERNNIPIIINHNNYFNNTKPHLYEMENFGENKLNEKNNNKRYKSLEKGEIAFKGNELKIEQQLKWVNEREKKQNDKEKILNEKERKFQQEKEKFEKEKNNENINLINRKKQLNKLEESLKEREEKFNSNQIKQEKIYKENLLKLKQKEDSLNKQEISLKNKLNHFAIEKKNFEEDKKNFELSKLPNEIGLQNIGATCYMNATLQSLSHTNLFTEYFLNKYHYDPNNNNKKMSNEMYKVLINLWSKNKKKGDYPPYDFKNALSEENPLFAGVQANDSKDLINFLLERFHTELNTANKGNINNNNNEIINQMDELQTLNAFIQEYFNLNKSIIIDCFYGILETKSKCCGCNITKYNFQIYSFLEFPLQEVNLYMYQNGRRASLINTDGSNPDIDLYECFDYYQKLELMNGQNQMYCNICNGNRDTLYGTLIYSLPNYLIINLNRGKGAVYSCKVIFPEILNILNYVTLKNGNTVMKLYAVICHYGPSSMSGHFIAYCRHRVNNKWYKYNDSIVTECTQQNEYYNGMPYILFYKAI